MKNLALFFCLISLNGFSQTFIRSELSTSLTSPWEITYGTDGYLWISEFGGQISRIHPETGDKQVVYSADDYSSANVSEKLNACWNPGLQSGTLGLTLHPDFMSNDSAFIYILYSYNAGDAANPETKFKIKQIKWNHETKLAENAVDLVTNIPTSYDHVGGRMLAVKRGDRNSLFLTIGDHGLSEMNSPDCYPDQSLNPNNLAQDPTAMNGKIHRFNMDGSIPFDNPIAGNSFYTRGHRNPQGLMYNANLDILYDVEHGDRTDDEINDLKAGMNYGWKDVRGYHDGNFPGELDYINQYTANPAIANDSLVPAFYSWCDEVTDTSANNASWCTVAPSDGVYYSHSAIPQWNNSLLVVTLKEGDNTNKEVYQFKLDSKGQFEASTAENPNPKKFFAEDQALNGRLRDICYSPDGKKIYLINSGGAPTSKITIYTVDETSIPEEPECASMYPNPVVDVLSARGFSKAVNCTIYNLQGEKVFEQLSDPAFIDISFLASGTYSVQLSTSSKTCVTKIVKVKN